jgi:hypothetical protein
MRRVGPPETEQLGQHGAVGLQAAPLVIGMRAALIAEQEAGAQDRSDRASIERLPHAFPVDDPSGRQNWDLDCSPSALDQFEPRRRTANVPAGLDSLSYHRICPCSLRGPCLLD